MLPPDYRDNPSEGLRRTVTIVNRRGLHARPAASFVKMANNFSSRIRIRAGDKDVDGKSIMGVMMLAAAQGDRIEIEAQGEDEETAIKQLSELVLNGFHEFQESV